MNFLIIFFTTTIVAIHSLETERQDGTFFHCNAEIGEYSYNKTVDWNPKDLSMT